MPNKTQRPAQYDELLRIATEIGERHPRSFVVIDTASNEVLATGTDAHKVFLRAQKKLKPGQVPMVIKKPAKGEIFIL